MCVVKPRLLAPHSPPPSFSASAGAHHSVHSGIVCPPPHSSCCCALFCFFVAGRNGSDHQRLWWSLPSPLRRGSLFFSSSGSLLPSRSRQECAFRLRKSGVYARVCVSVCVCVCVRVYGGASLCQMPHSFSLPLPSCSSPYARTRRLRHLCHRISNLPHTVTRSVATASRHRPPSFPTTQPSRPAEGTRAEPHTPASLELFFSSTPLLALSL
jgi:hypothetical protein